MGALPALALLPVALVLALMAGARWAAAPAGLAGLALALPIALFAFGWRGPALEDASAAGIVPALGGVAAEAGFTTLTILWIVFPALWLHELQLGTGATATLRQALARLSEDPRLAALLVAWFFALFSEGAAGFGTPVALAAPILVGLGFEPARAVALALVGHAVGVSFGALGTPLVPQLAAGGFEPTALAGATALLHLALGWTMALALHRIVGQGRAGPGWALLAAACFLLPFAAIAAFVGPELPTLGGALLGGLAFALAVRRREGGSGPAPTRAALLAAALPYLMLLALVLATRLLPPLREALAGLEWRWSLLEGSFTGRIQPLYHPGTLLLLALVAGGLLRRDAWTAFRGAAVRASGRLPAVLLALVAMLALARLMVHAGMIEALAEGAAGLAGGAWPLLAPAAGAVGTFVTGSATASNILLTDLQLAVAATLGLPAVWMAAAQGFGAAVGNIICPHNIVAGGATVGLAGREGEVMRRTLPACALYAALGGALVFAITAVD
ncbi:L-lactate permease [Falsiroseomonas sp.]|uniref:L-lactate permease n=1 Tax=Falsiroseomonas sp. TaxID=2870721 RepID=UPI003565FB80